MDKESIVLPALFQALTPAALASFAPPASFAPAGASHDVRRAATAGTAKRELEGRGWLELSFERTRVAGISTTIEALVAAGHPPLMALAFDDVWALGEALARGLSEALATEYVLVADVWAYCIDKGEAGWPPHRGVTELLDRNSPAWLNTWIAISDVERDRACMHFVPLDADPNYPARLAEIDVANAQPAPVAAGTALVWNANVLHWGGACAASAKGARHSLAFTLARRDGASDPILTRPDPWKRLEIIAQQIGIYGAKDPSITEALRQWAQLTLAMREKVRL